MPEKTILALVGMPSAGKGAVLEYFKKGLNDKKIEVIRFSDSLTEALGIFFDEIKREDQQWLVYQLRQRFGRDILARAVERKLKQNEFEIAILDGVRVKSEEKMARKYGAKIVFVDAPARLRWKRSQKRGEKKDDNVSFEKFQQLDNADSEREIKEIGRRADFKINNTGDFCEIEKQVKEILKELNI